MADFIRSTLIPDETPAADGTYTYDLPVNPLSHIILAIKCLNATDEATLAQILALVSNITVANRGQSIINMSAADLYALNTVLFPGVPVITNAVATDDATRSVGLCIPFSRRLFTPDEAFPASKAGELTLSLTVDIATTHADGLILLADTVELPEATPQRFLKATTLASTPSATGQHDVSLPIGNPLLGLLLWGTTVPTGTAWTATIDQIRLLADNIERDYANAYWETMHADLVHRGGMPLGAVDDWSDDAIANYALLDLDPNKDSMYAIDTAPLASLKARIEAGDTNALRVIPIELPAVA